jgi:branched-chain amino acid transport system permease protein
VNPFANPKRLGLPWRSPAWIVGIALAICWPLIASSNYSIEIGTLALTYLVLGESLNLLYGYAGYLCLGIPVFWATGGYVAAHLTVASHLNSSLAIVLGGVGGAVIAAMFGLVALPRGRGAFAMLSLILLIFAGLLVNNWGLVGGAQGIYGLGNVVVGPSALGIVVSDTRQYYYATLVLAAICVGALFVAVSSRWGRTLNATRVDESLAASFGIPLLRERMRALAIAGFLSGIVGGLYVFNITLADPSLLSPSNLAPLFGILLLGGPGNVGGVAIGAVVITFLPQITRDFQTQSNLVYGLLLVVLCLVFPEGVPATVESWYHGTIRKRRTPRSTGSVAAGLPAAAVQEDSST